MTHLHFEAQIYNIIFTQRKSIKNFNRSLTILGGGGNGGRVWERWEVVGAVGALGNGGRVWEVWEGVGGVGAVGGGGSGGSAWEWWEGVGAVGGCGRCEPHGR